MSLTPFPPDMHMRMYGADVEIKKWKKETYGSLVFYLEGGYWMGYKNGEIFINGITICELRDEKIPRYIWAIAQENDRLYVTSEEINKLEIKGHKKTASNDTSKLDQVRNKIKGHKKHLTTKITECFDEEIPPKMAKFLQEDFLVFRSSNLYINRSAGIST